MQSSSSCSFSFSTSVILSSQLYSFAASSLNFSSRLLYYFCKALFVASVSFWERPSFSFLRSRISLSPLWSRWVGAAGIQVFCWERRSVSHAVRCSHGSPCTPLWTAFVGALKGPPTCLFWMYYCGPCGLLPFQAIILFVCIVKCTLQKKEGWRRCWPVPKSSGNKSNPFVSWIHGAVWCQRSVRKTDFKNLQFKWIHF